jgi:hypothetical protein
MRRDGRLRLHLATTSTRDMAELGAASPEAVDSFRLALGRALEDAEALTPVVGTAGPPCGRRWHPVTASAGTGNHQRGQRCRSVTNPGKGRGGPAPPGPPTHAPDPATTTQHKPISAPSLERAADTAGGAP